VDVILLDSTGMPFPLACEGDGMCLLLVPLCLLCLCKVLNIILGFRLGTSTDSLFLWRRSVLTWFMICSKNLTVQDC
jgi:hypothetical protein